MNGFSMMWQEEQNRLAYEGLRQALSATVREPVRLTELALQAQIFAGEFGSVWRGEDGEEIEVVHFGEWNREPGPDFCRARVRINGTEQVGAIEVDPEVRDWENHGHAANPAFDGVVLHMFLRRGARRFFTRTSDHRAVSQVCLARPYTERLERPAGGTVLGREAAGHLIEAGAEFRLFRKIERFQRAAKLGGRKDALFQSIATGLGYKNNKVPFLLVAQRAGLERAGAVDGEALLFGLAGFLQAEDFAEGDDEARRYLRELWESWWTVRAREERLVLQNSAWRLGGLRPANHPHRRLGALATVARSFATVTEARTADAFAKVLQEARHSFWDRHYNLACDRLPRVTRLIGPDRALDLTINAFAPSLPLTEAREVWRGLTGPSPNSRVIKALDWLCPAGGEFLSSSLHQQGLLQVYEDFFPHDPEEIWQTHTRNVEQNLPVPGVRD